MRLTLTTLELRILKYAAEGKDIIEMAEYIKLSPKETEKLLGGVCKRLNQKKPLEALQHLGKIEFMVMD